MLASSYIEQDHSSELADHRLTIRLLRFVRPYWKLIVLSSAVSLAMAVLQLVGPYLVKLTIDNYIAAGDVLGIAQMSALYLLTVVVGFFLEYWQGWLIAFVGQEGMRRLRHELFAHLQKLDLAFFDRNPVGRLLTRVTSDVQALNELFSQGVMTVAGDIFLLIAIVVLMLKTSHILTLLVFTTAPLVLIAGHLFSTHVRAGYSEVRAKLSQLNAFVQESLGGIRTVQTYNRQKAMGEKFAAINEELRRAHMRTVFAHAIFLPAIELIAAIALALILWRGGIGSLDGSITLGTVYLFIQYTQRFFQPIKDLSDKFNIYQTAMAAAERIFKLLDTQPRIVSPPNAIKVSRMERSITFENVWFAYQGEEWVLRDVSFEVRRGETVAIVGPTGSGKSTILNLLARFYDVQRGAIRIDGTDIRKMDLHSLRSLLAIVLQDVFLFSGDIASNIRLGRDSISMEKVRESARYVNAALFIEKFPENYRHEVRERGATLSVGQKQLLAFARALAFDPQILLLDEATASIDTETELIIQDALQKLLHGRTSIVVAHRLSTIRHADKIIVLHHGKVREVGTHTELLSRNGLYRRLYELQFRDGAQGGQDTSEKSSAPLIAST
ncbi:MAG: ABC transporter ATP-binding protein [Candidatus Hydrogenedentota bacterium]|uniref:Lipid A export ATP-binding/permease protein MsbA n=1 Tax=Sumerlaea chitinivorans TaxID=2250252 RepID=A0A2Z4Y4L1_SUMC1|nr:Lipid A export ATP-binding/permease protein MsbA [Candidatus Sumerlaea chitinivorans]RMH25975.1 MAG: ABC transporter ATP-binding protein [Candidatus Hydrogenedentota bacterium]GIX44134.1 MAG: ABC transporter ATP-binding protein [Candidatus Sumerlaea sp.]